jgi:hypothetical protein
VQQRGEFGVGVNVGEMVDRARMDSKASRPHDEPACGTVPRVMLLGNAPES